MSTELRERIAKLLSDITGDMNKEVEKEIVDNAYLRLSASKKEIGEENIIDAVLAAFNEDEEELLFEENPHEEDLFDLLRVSSYDDNIILGAIEGFEKNAASIADLRNGAEGSYYDKKGKTYLPDGQKPKEKMDEYELNDGAHDKIIYHNLATKTEDSKNTTDITNNTHRTRADLLVR